MRTHLFIRINEMFWSQITLLLVIDGSLIGTELLSEIFNCQTRPAC
jgi:hypothetical protein